MALHNWPEADEDNSSVKRQAAHLMRQGPCLRIELRAPAGASDGVQGFGLIDTGASTTAVYQQAFSKLNVPPVDAAPVYLPSGKQRFLMFPADIHFLDADIPPRRHARLFGMSHPGLGPDEEPLLALLGRDFLRTGLFVYNGATGRWTLSWERSEAERTYRTTR